MQSASPAATPRRTSLQLLLSAALIAAPCAAGAAGLSGGYSEASNGGSPRDNARWMADLPDATPIGRLSLVGSHDAATGKMNPNEPFVTPLAKTQSMKIDRQLAAGIRALDLRCKHVNDRCALHHGAIGLAQDLSEVLDMVTGFLRQNQSETVFLHLNNPDSGGSDGKPENNTNPLFADTFLGKYWNNPNYYAFFWKGPDGRTFPTGKATDRSTLPATLPTLGEVRGKIVVFQDFSPESQRGWFGLPGQNQYRDPALPNTFRPWVHRDDTSYIVDNMGAFEEFWQRKRPVLDHANAADDAEGAQAVHMVWLNGSGNLGQLIIPKDVARHVNAQANRHIFNALHHASARPRAGMMMADYPDLNLIENVISLNFKGLEKHAFSATFEAINDRIEVSVNGVDVFETSKSQASLAFGQWLRPGVNQIGVRLGNNDCFGTSLKLKLFRDQTQLTERDFRKRVSDCGRQLSWSYSLNTVNGEWRLLE